MGYRPKTNSYDGWSLPMWEQMIRDLAVFGTNTIEIMPPRTDDEPSSRHFPLPQLETMIGVSQICADYDLDVSVWYPAIDGDYSDPKTAERSVSEWAAILGQLPRVNAVFVPGGDPGHTHPDVLFALLERQAASLRSLHPGAEMWVSAQGFSQAWIARFLELLRKEPAWLTGVVHGPHTHIRLPDLRKALPDRYAIRNYPDITHTYLCGDPVTEWDVAYALTQGREPINPRPLHQAEVFRTQLPYTQGFVTYSEGCNDDVNKFIWSGLGWDPTRDSVDILREYSAYHLRPTYRETFTQGLLALERNWQGPLLANPGVDVTLQQFQALEDAATPHDKLNWRFQQALYRAYYDAYVRARLIYETALETEANSILRQAERLGSRVALSEAERVLNRAVTAPIASDLRARLFELGEALYQSIRMQLSVQRYEATGLERGANLDGADHPLNDAPWLKERFEEIRALTDEAERLASIKRILSWTHPGPGGFYDSLGSMVQERHMVQPERKTGLTLLYSRTPRKSWLTTYAGTLIDPPLRLHYPHVDPAASYRVRILYAGRRDRSPRPLIEIGLTANGYEVHPHHVPDFSGQPVEFAIPPEATAAGSLTLEWIGPDDFVRGAHSGLVSEVWLLRDEAAN